MKQSDQLNLSATLGHLKPSDLQALWKINAVDFRQLQYRGLTHLKKRGTLNTPATYDVVQAAQVGLQTALVREVKMSAPAANQMAQDAAVEIRKLFLSSEPTAGKSILFAVQPDPAKWMRITLDTPITVVEETLGSNIWLVVDVGFYVERVCKAIAEKHPEAYAAWMAARVRRNN